MRKLVRPLQAFGVVVGAFAVVVFVSIFSSRKSLSLLFLMAVCVLPLAFWFQWGFKKCCIAFFVFAVSLGISPIDFTIQRSGQKGLHLLPISYGMACQPGTACYGCIVRPNAATKALVLSY